MDGDCAVRCFLVQLGKVITVWNPPVQEKVRNKLKELGLVQETEEEQIIYLRKIFLNTVLKEESY